MKKDQKFLNELDKKLGNISSKKKEKIILKYRNLIDEEKKNNKKITEIIKSFGNIDEIVSKELSITKSNNIFNNIKKFFIRIKDKISNLFKKKKNKKSKKNIKEIKEEIKENIESEIPIVTGIAVEKKLFEPKKKRIKRIIIKVIKVIILLVLLFLWLWFSILFVSGIFAVLDGIKIYGINIILFSLMLLTLWLLLVINNSLMKHKPKKLFWLISLIIILFILGLGIVMTIYKIKNIELVEDVSDKYNFTRKYEEYNLPINENKKFYINFNSNYNTKYEIEYSDTMDGKIGIEVKYYECYYNYYNKKGNHNVYISLKQDLRDKISVYIDNLKDDKIYDSLELSRYTVKITGSEKDLERVVIN